MINVAIHIKTYQKRLEENIKSGYFLCGGILDSCYFLNFHNSLQWTCASITVRNNVYLLI